MLIEWNGSLEIGNPLIDDDHRRLVAEANELYDIISAKEKSDIVLAKIRDFAASLYRHFVAEEQLMQESGYPGLEAHAADHTAFAREIDQLLVDCDIRTDYLDTLVPLVFRFMALHRDGADAALVEFLRTRSP